MNSSGITDFLIEMSSRQNSITRLFSGDLLGSIRRHLGMERAAILCFDEHNHFLSWTDEAGVKGREEPHPYAAFASNDVVEHAVYYTALQQRLDYFNTIPRLCRSTDVISPADYENSAYVRFLQENVGARYSVTLAFGTNGFIQLVFFKTLEEGDFTRDEMLELENLYVIIAGFYSNFKKQEQERIISGLKDRVITSEDRAYFIADGFDHVLMCNPAAGECLRELFGIGAPDPEEPQLWLPMILRGASEDPDAGPSGSGTLQTDIRDHRFLIHIHEQKYEHGIVEKYYLVIVRKDGKTLDGEESVPGPSAAAPCSAAECLTALTASERRVAELLGEGRTYRQIAEELTISYHTVKKHVENIYSKLGIGSRYQLYNLMGK